MATSSFNMNVTVGTEDFMVSIIATHWAPGVGTGQPRILRSSWVNASDLDSALAFAAKAVSDLCVAEQIAHNGDIPRR